MKKILIVTILISLLALTGCAPIPGYIIYAYAQEPTPVTVVGPVTVAPPEAPGTPGDITVSGITENRATISWPPVSGATQYSIWVNGSRWTGSTSPGATIQGLQPYTIYEVCVTSANESGENSPSTAVSFTTLPPVPTAPSVPIVANVSGDTAMVQWEPLPLFQYIQAYRVYVDGIPIADVEHQDGLQAAELTNLENGEHVISVSGINSNREGPASAPTRFTIQAVSVPGGLVMINHSPDAIWLRWNEVSKASKYIININGQLAGETSGTSIKIGDLQPGQEYAVEAIAVLSNGDKSKPATIQANTIYVEIITKESIMQSIFSYAPDVFPGLLMIFVCGAAFALATAARESITRRSFWIIRR